MGTAADSNTTARLEISIAQVPSKNIIGRLSAQPRRQQARIWPTAVAADLH